jgi:hypothetical protein
MLPPDQSLTSAIEQFMSGYALSAAE